MNLENKIQERINQWQSDNILKTPKYLILDYTLYFILKELVFGSTEMALEEEMEDYLGLKVVFNNFGIDIIDVAG